MREPINTHAYTKIGPAELGEEWDVLLLGTGQWTRATIVYEFEDEIKKRAISGHIFRRDHEHRRSAIPLPWVTARGDLDYVRSVVKQVIRAAGLRDDLSFTSFRHGGFTEGADLDLTDAELRAAGRHRSARQLPTYAKRTRKQLVSVATKRRAERTKAANLSE
jgi:hypothetical protein